MSNTKKIVVKKQVVPTKMGRPKSFTVETFTAIYEKYKKYVLDNPRFINQLNQRTGQVVAIPMKTPMTIDGFQVFVKNTTGLTSKDYFDNDGGAYDEFSPITTHIRQEIRADQVAGALVGQYNANLTARLNSIKEQSENTNINHNVQLLTIDPLDDSADNEPT